MNEQVLSRVIYDFEVAFLSSGLRPVAGDFGDGEEIGCAVTAYAKAGQPGYLNDEEAVLRGLDWDVVMEEFTGSDLCARFPGEDLRWWSWFVQAMEEGFDSGNVGREHEYAKGTAKWWGFRCGLELARRVFGEAPVEEAPVKEAVTA